MPILSRAIVFIFIAVVFALIGLIVGYFKGAEDWAGYTASSEAIATVTTLRELREKQFNEAIRLLETELDTLIARRAIYEQGFRPLTYFSSDADEEKLMRQVAEYRRAHPSRAKDEPARLLIDDLLKKYR